VDGIDYDSLTTAKKTEMQTQYKSAFAIAPVTVDMVTVTIAKANSILVQATIAIPSSLSSTATSIAAGIADGSVTSQYIGGLVNATLAIPNIANFLEPNATLASISVNPSSFTSAITGQVTTTATVGATTVVTTTTTGKSAGATSDAIKVAPFVNRWVALAVAVAGVAAAWTPGGAAVWTEGSI